MTEGSTRSGGILHVLTGDNLYTESAGADETFQTIDVYNIYCQGLKPWGCTTKSGGRQGILNTDVDPTFHQYVYILYIYIYILLYMHSKYVTLLSGKLLHCKRTFPTSPVPSDFVAWSIFDFAHMLGFSKEIIVLRTLSVLHHPHAIPSSRTHGEFTRGWCNKRYWSR